MCPVFASLMAASAKRWASSKPQGLVAAFFIGGPDVARMHGFTLMCRNDSDLGSRLLPSMPPVQSHRERSFPWSLAHRFSFTSRDASPNWQEPLRLGADTSQPLPSNGCRARAQRKPPPCVKYAVGENCQIGRNGAGAAEELVRTGHHDHESSWARRKDSGGRRKQSNPTHYRSRGTRRLTVKFVTTGWLPRIFNFLFFRR